MNGIERCIDDEIPFEIPDTWKWGRFYTVCVNIVDCPHSTPVYLSYPTDYWAIDTNCIDDNGNIIKKRYLDKNAYQTRTKQLIPQGNDLVLSREGTIGLVAILPPSENICLGQRVMLLRPSCGINCKYLQLLLMAKNFLRQFMTKAKGMGVLHINVGDIRGGLIPIPPLAEQKRIVAEIEKILKVQSTMRSK